MSRIKPTPPIVADIKQVEGALAEIAALDRKLGTIESSLNESIDAAKQRAKDESSAMLVRRKELADAIGTYATMNKAELFKDRKSLDLAFGVIGFRQSTQIIQLNKVTKEMTLEKIQEYNFNDGLRIKTDINKEGMMSWPDERLQLVGMKRKQLDTFFIEIKAEDIANANKDLPLAL